MHISRVTCWGLDDSPVTGTKRSNPFRPGSASDAKTKLNLWHSSNSSDFYRLALSAIDRFAGLVPLFAFLGVVGVREGSKSMMFS
jgi:hypothetical protein